MRAMLEFNLDDYDDKLAHLRCTQALNLALALYKVQERLRHYAKYDTDNHLEQSEFFDILSSHGVDLDNLVS
jgi:hypothetical protein